MNPAEIVAKLRRDQEYVWRACGPEEPDDGLYGEAADRIELLSAKCFAADQALERAYCTIVLGITEPDPEYGWPVGEHVPESMADALIGHVARLVEGIPKNQGATP